jgi:glucose-6-phosphate isomerase
MIGKDLPLMRRYEDALWKKEMTLIYDYSNLMDSFIDASAQDPKFRKSVGAISEADLDAMMPRIVKARESLSRKWGRPSRMLAWTRLPYSQKTVVADILRTAARVRRKFDNFVVLGIGGSALGPIAVHDALAHPFYNLVSREERGGGPRLFVEDNVDPERMKALLAMLDITKTCFNVITKSGSTSETMSQFLIVRDLLRSAVGDRWRHHVIATTDKKRGSLIRIAQEDSLKTFAIPDGVGGRFSELSAVGLLPAAVCGIDIEELLAGAAWMDELCAREDIRTNPGWMSGALMALTMTRKGKNIQVMMPYSNALKTIADWYAQLWAESLGKKYTQRGRVIHAGQTPVKALGVTDQHSQIQLYTEGPFDKVITLLAVGAFRGDVDIPEGYPQIHDVHFLSGHTMGELMTAERMATEFVLAKAGKLNQTITLPEINAFTIGQLLYFFEVQTAVAGELIGIDTFDQPGVEEGKIATFALLGRPGFEQKRAEITAQPTRYRRYMIGF